MLYKPGWTQVDLPWSKLDQREVSVLFIGTYNSSDRLMKNS
jgi:hypothetical protein